MKSFTRWIIINRKAKVPMEGYHDFLYRTRSKARLRKLDDEMIVKVKIERIL
jgi:hypothetical protein